MSAFRICNSLLIWSKALLPLAARTFYVLAAGTLIFVASCLNLAAAPTVDNLRLHKWRHQFQFAGYYAGVAIVAAIVSMALTLTLRIVAEGVETQAQRVLPACMETMTLPGYLASPPVPGPGL